MEKSVFSSPKPKITRPVLSSHSSRSNSSLRRSAPVTSSSARVILPKKSSSLLDDPEMCALREINWEKDDLAGENEETLAKFFNYLKEYAVECASNSDYKGAKRASELAEISKACRIKIMEEAAVPIEDDVSFDPINKKYDEQLENIEIKYSARLNILKRRQAREKAKLDEEWSGEKVIRYRKPSARLIRLSAVLKCAIEAGDFARAESIDKDLHKLQAEETEANQQLLINDYNNAMFRLKQAHQEELEQVSLDKEKQREIVEAERNVELRHAENRNKVLQQKRESAKRKYAKTHNIQPSRFNVQQQTVFLDLVPPTDPTLQAEEREKRREQARRNNELQKRNIKSLERFKYVEPPPVPVPPENTKTKKRRPSNQTKAVKELSREVVTPQNEKEEEKKEIVKEEVHEEPVKEEEVKKEEPAKISLKGAVLGSMNPELNKQKAEAAKSTEDDAFYYATLSENNNLKLKDPTKPKEPEAVKESPKEESIKEEPKEESEPVKESPKEESVKEEPKEESTNEAKEEPSKKEIEKSPREPKKPENSEEKVEKSPRKIERSAKQENESDGDEEEEEDTRTIVLNPKGGIRFKAIGIERDEALDALRERLMNGFKFSPIKSKKDDNENRYKDCSINDFVFGPFDSMVITKQPEVEEVKKVRFNANDEEDSKAKDFMKGFVFTSINGTKDDKTKDDESKKLRKNQSFGTIVIREVIEAGNEQKTSNLMNGFKFTSTSSESKNNEQEKTIENFETKPLGGLGESKFGTF